MKKLFICQRHARFAINATKKRKNCKRREWMLMKDWNFHCVQTSAHAMMIFLFFHSSFLSFVEQQKINENLYLSFSTASNRINVWKTDFIIKLIYYIIANIFRAKYKCVSVCCVAIFIIKFFNYKIFFLSTRVCNFHTHSIYINISNSIENFFFL
jgi:hypothetical protein